jgi:hypothetical protein
MSVGLIALLGDCGDCKGGGRFPRRCGQCRALADQGRLSIPGVLRTKAALSSRCKPYSAIAPRSPSAACRRRSIKPCHSAGSVAAGFNGDTSNPRDALSLK